MFCCVVTRFKLGKKRIRLISIKFILETTSRGNINLQNVLHAICGVKFQFFEIKPSQQRRILQTMWKLWKSGNMVKQSGGDRENYQQNWENQTGFLDFFYHFCEN